MTQTQSEREDPGSATLREGTEGGNDACYKLHQLIQRWDNLPAVKCAVVGKDQAHIRHGVRVINDRELAIFLNLKGGACKSEHLGDQGLMFILNIEIVNRAERGISILIRPQLSQNATAGAPALWKCRFLI